MITLRTAFALLITAQAAHSCEEYLGRLYEVFPPARFISGLISSDLQRGFVIFNVALLAFGLWCAVWPVGRGWPSASCFAWVWVAIELLNGIGHPLWSIVRGGYTPGIGTAPLLLVLALVVARQLRAKRPSSAAAT